jgi:hypothetical protein
LAKELGDALERENVRLKRLVADLSLEKQILKDVAAGRERVLQAAVQFVWQAADHLDLRHDSGLHHNGRKLWAFIAGEVSRSLHRQNRVLLELSLVRVGIGAVEQLDAADRWLAKHPAPASNPPDEPSKLTKGQRRRLKGKKRRTLLKAKAKAQSHHKQQVLPRARTDIRDARHLGGASGGRLERRRPGRNVRRAVRYECGGVVMDRPKQR